MLQDLFSFINNPFNQLFAMEVQMFIEANFIKGCSIRKELVASLTHIKIQIFQIMSEYIGSFSHYLHGCYQYF